MLKIGGVYASYDTPMSDLVESASEVYLGGHIHEVTDEVACALASAGYIVGNELGWMWNAVDSSWVGNAGPVPAGYSFPANGATTPDLSALLAPLDDGDPGNGEIEVFPVVRYTNVCLITTAGTAHATYHYNTGEAQNQWEGTVGLPGSTPAADLYLYVMASGPAYDDTDPAPSWAPVEALG